MRYLAVVGYPGVRLGFLLLLVVGGAAWVGWTYVSGRHTPASYVAPLPPAPHAVAVMPFGVEVAEWRGVADGIVHLLSARIGGNGDLRRVNPHAVLSRVRRSVASRELDAANAAPIAKQLGARSYVLGTLAGAGERVRLSARWYEVDAAGGGEEATVEGPVAELADLVDRLGEQLTANRVAADQVRIARVAAVSSQSPAALRSYFDGEAAFAAGGYAAALHSLNAAVDADPQFALAFYRLAVVAGWSGLPEMAVAARQQALLLSNRLPMQERLLLDIELSELRGESAAAAARYRAVVAAAPDEWEAWLRLGDLDTDRRAARQSIEKAVTLMPEQPAVQERARRAD